MLMRPVAAGLPPLPLQQSQYWADALRACGRRVVTTDLGGLGHLVQVDVPLWRLGRATLASRGPLWMAEAMPTDRIAALVAHGPRLLNAEREDEIVLRTAGYRQILSPASVAELPLQISDVAQIAQCSAKWRNALRQGRRREIWVSAQPAAGALLEWLLDRETNTRCRKGYRGLPKDFLRALVSAAGDDARIWTAGPAVAPLAAMLILRHGMSATYLIGWSGDAGRAVSAHHIILMAAATDLAGLGCRTLDLGTVDTARAPGLARFKIGAGAQVRPLGGTWLRVPGLARHDLAC